MKAITLAHPSPPLSRRRSAVRISLASALLGALLVTKVQLAAMSRADLPEKARRDFFLYVDEFQNFATDSFAAILSEARKYRLNLTIANQYLAQMGESTLAAVFGNIGSIIS